MWWYFIIINIFIWYKNNSALKIIYHLKIKKLKDIFGKKINKP